MNASFKTSGDAAPESAPTVLVVEDEVLVRMVVSDYLRDCAFHVVEAGSGDEAIQILEAGIEVDIVFSDVHMPGKTDGFALSQWVRRERPGVKVILTSGVARSAKAAGDLCEEGPLLAKPYNHRDLERHIRGLLDR
ncbi:MAG: response regulator [Alphaproteobacteria bacterium]|jgi:CheY-like chemotaxis protein|nr:response regulator [Alphaproteobacteria bacterium]